MLTFIKTYKNVQASHQHLHLLHSILGGFRMQLSLSYSTGVDCSTPKQPNHCTVSYNETRYNMVVVYKCDEGYSLIGPSTRVCQYSGKWSGEEPFCECKHAQ